MVIPSTLDGNTEYNIAEGIANTIFPGFFDFNKNLEQVKVLFSNLDGEFLMMIWVGLARAQTGAPRPKIGIMLILNRDYTHPKLRRYCDKTSTFKFTFFTSFILINLNTLKRVPKWKIEKCLGATPQAIIMTVFLILSDQSW